MQRSSHQPHDLGRVTRVAEPGGRPLVVFLGVENDLRSRLAAAFLQRRAAGLVLARSVSHRRGQPDETVRKVAAEFGIDLDRVPSQPASPAALRHADVIVAIGYGCHELASQRRAHQDWCIDDPCGREYGAVYTILDAIDRRVQRLLRELTTPRSPVRLQRT